MHLLAKHSIEGVNQRQMGVECRLDIVPPMALFRLDGVTLKLIFAQCISATAFVSKSYLDVCDKNSTCI